MPSTPLSIIFNFQGQTTKPHITKGIYWSLFNRNLTSTSSSLARHFRPRFIVLSDPFPASTHSPSEHALCSWSLQRLHRALSWPALHRKPQTPSLLSSPPCLHGFLIPAELALTLAWEPTHHHPHAPEWAGKRRAVIKDNGVPVWDYHPSVKGKSLNSFPMCEKLENWNLIGSKFTPFYSHLV